MPCRKLVLSKRWSMLTQPAEERNEEVVVLEFLAGEKWNFSSMEMTGMGNPESP